MNNLLELKGAFSLLTKFDTEEDDKKIDSVICYALEKGLDINDLYLCDEDSDYYELEIM
jgi:hypothetical protein